ncbi:sulfatase [Rhizorhabdus wittichii RW1]|uniref:Sulfatase n=1 Tax=Rhizorhabdus wittichii (strain DSM 6014 / CCUG 31198 / JCM 15750 / NBRC 105917 / EY 4224 / RW1) TaxID=392499 RepID=A0A9J9LF14_RHIWR|nr:sulfatase [Rhizorhabdus wittichii RW1]
MVKRRLLGAALALLAGTGLTAVAGARSPAAPSPQRPNILLIVADDLGYSDIGAFGGEIATPNLDRLAQAGVRFADFHAAPACSPTRAMLLTGRDHHAAGLGTMAEFTDPAQRGRPGYEGYLKLKMPTIASALSARGYYTAMAGKWHLGYAEKQSPKAHGFARSFALLDGAGNHYGIDQTAQWRSVGIGVGTQYREDGRLTTFPEGAYSSDLFTEKLIGYLTSPARAHRPFFAYLAFTAPHWPLQAPADVVAKYSGKYDDGPMALRERRLKRMKELGIVPPDVRPFQPLAVEDWTTLSAERRRVEARKMEIYAAMVDRLDQNVGRLLASLSRSGDLGNTIVVFLSDNGPDGGGGAPALHDPRTQASLGIDNSLENMGRAHSFLTYGAGWAQAGSAPFNRFKGYTTEGGTRVPAFISGAGVTWHGISHALTHVTDMMPTALALAAGPASSARKPATEGRSLVPLLRDARIAQVRQPDEAIGEELFFGRSLRAGQWKAVYPAPTRPPTMLSDTDGRWHLYDLSVDPGETRDLAAEHTDILAGLVRHWHDYARRNDVVLHPAAD